MTGRWRNYSGNLWKICDIIGPNPLEKMWINWLMQQGTDYQSVYSPFSVISPSTCHLRLFSVMSVCHSIQGEGYHVTITDDALELTGPLYRDPHTCSNLFIMNHVRLANRWLAFYCNVFLYWNVAWEQLNWHTLGKLHANNCFSLSKRIFKMTL